MATSPTPVERRSHDPELERRYASRTPKPVPKGKFRALGFGIITGASDDDPTAVGTYANAGAAFGSPILWVVPLAYPMMVIVVYLSSITEKAGRWPLTIKPHISRFLWPFRVLYEERGNN
jgi:hypothetical protein